MSSGSFSADLPSLTDAPLILMSTECGPKLQALSLSSKCRAARVVTTVDMDEGLLGAQGTLAAILIFSHKKHDEGSVSY